jgi:hypothetical protein
MEPLKRKVLEDDLVEAIRKRLHAEGWHTEKTHGSLYAQGWPDLYAIHPNHKQRWIEVKRREEGALEETQIRKFTTWAKFGLGVYILTSAADSEIKKLWGEPNWWAWTSPALRRAITRRGKRG